MKPWCASHVLWLSLLVMLVLTNVAFSECDKAKQQQALAAIRLRSQIELDQRGLPSWIKGQIAPRNGEVPVQSALTTLEMIRDAFCAATNDGFAFTGHLEKEDRLGQTHVRIKQTYRGLDVLGPELTVHMTQDSVTIINGHFLPGIDLPTNPVLTSQEVSRIALEHVTAMGGVEESVRAIHPLVVFACEMDQGHLAYPVETAYKLVKGNRYQVGGHLDDFFVDAITGVVVGKHAHIIRD